MAEESFRQREPEGPATGQQNATLHLLRRKIVSGEFAPGDRLPPRKEFSEGLGVSPVTLQRAIDQLQREGFVRSVDRVGSFVETRPPHLYRYPFIVPSGPGSPVGGWGRFWQLLVNAAPGVASDKNRQIPVCMNIDGHADNEDYQSLVRDIELKRLAGLIFITNPFLLKETPLITEPGLPRVAITRWADDMHVVVPNFSSFFERSIEYLAQQGCKRIAVLMRDGMDVEWKLNLQKLINAHGLETRPEWLQYVGSAGSARTILHLLMSPLQTIRPDGLIVCDDNWIEHATAGLIAAGVHVPDDVTVVSHCNFPRREPMVLPFKRLGWDVRDLIGHCIDVLDNIRENRPQPKEQIVPARFDHELLQPDM